eukprot:TRINITY_DN10117_c0_g3_i2.p4 TRINITY_DN10117_c0_g3~~TRINITY_DN10117_c0_g3_i2.p4  ORF type:complete len:113 (-),score=35.00 TRINITY_DN10117_c0_g3_i2:44-382(-)
MSAGAVSMDEAIIEAASDPEDDLSLSRPEEYVDDEDSGEELAAGRPPEDSALPLEPSRTESSLTSERPRTEPSLTLERPRLASDEASSILSLLGASPKERKHAGVGRLFGSM